MIFSTLKLDKTAWDLTVDGLGNIAVDSTSGAVAQDVASIIRVVQGELFFDVTQGIPYFLNVLGQSFSPQLFTAFLQQAALSVPGVVRANVTLNPLDKTRNLVGTVQVIDETGQSLNAHF